MKKVTILLLISFQSIIIVAQEGNFKNTNQEKNYFQIKKFLIDHRFNASLFQDQFNQWFTLARKKGRWICKAPLVRTDEVWFHHGMNRFNLIACAKLLAVAAAISLLSGCITNPETGRRQLLLVSESEMTQLG